MLHIRAAVFAAIVTLAAISFTPPALAGDAAPAEPDCGQGRAWWPPLEACVTLPVLKKMVDPEYGSAVPGLRYGAILYVRVLDTGLVGDVQVVKAPPEGDPAEGDDTAIQALLKAVRQWRFSPGLGPDGKPIGMSVTLKVHLLTEE
ncbi:MAG TPA: hypothetical protein VFV75_08115 [Candidatus Polarisedimenticolaceae bacterium]|nr:hypothetical protein [Candidatus Polarisedimenticolaceae bacterium]